MPPNHCEKQRHRPIVWFSAGMSVSTLAPVVVMPDIDSKYASIGYRSCDSPNMYEIEIERAASAHVSETTRNPSRAPIVSPPFVSRSRPQPKSAVITPAATNGQIGSPYPSPTITGNR